MRWRHVIFGIHYAKADSIAKHFSDCRRSRALSSSPVSPLRTRDDWAICQISRTFVANILSLINSIANQRHDDCEPQWPTVINSGPIGSVGPTCVSTAITTVCRQLVCLHNMFVGVCREWVTEPLSVAIDCTKFPQTAGHPKHCWQLPATVATKPQFNESVEQQNE